VLVFHNEASRDKNLPIVKTILKSYDPNAKASAYLTKYELQHKALVYNELNSL
jgi:hypothetical protein